jgi:hypothetical protein
MPVPFRDLRDEEGLGLAGYLRFVTEDGGRGIRGALFLVNARGEPVDFAFSRIDVPASFLWRPGEAKRQAVASLAAVLLKACPKTPSLLLALSNEVHPGVFTEDVLVEVPLCRITEADNVPYSEGESSETLSDTVRLVWVGQVPKGEGPARRLLEALHGRQLTIEPFERAGRGIDEAFRE